MDIRKALEYPLPVLVVSEKEVVIEMGSEGSFSLRNAGGGVLAGEIISHDHRLTFEPASWEGNRQTVKCRMSDAEVESETAFSALILSNGGEAQITVTILPDIPSSTAEDVTDHLQKFDDYMASDRLKRKRPLKAWLNRDGYNYQDEGTLVIQNKINEPLWVELFCKEAFVRFPQHRYKVEGQLSIPFIVKLSASQYAKMLFRKVPFLSADIEIHAIYKNKRIKKIVTLTASDLLPIESAAETHNDTRASVAVAQALHQWLTYAVVDVPEPQEYLHRANHVVWSTLRSNGFDLWLYWLSIFFAIELGHMEKARDMLEVAYSHRSYYKRKAPFYYNVMHFLYASLEIKQNRIKSAEKYIRVLEASGNPLMLGMLYLALKEYEAAYKLLVASYKAGCRSIFLFNALLMYYRKTDNRQLQPSDQDLLQQVIRWAINRGADVERWQIQLPGLNRCIVQVAFENEAKQIRHYTMAQYLQNPDNDMDLQIYMYHLLLTDANLADLIDSQLDKIIQMAEYCQQNDIQGRHARSLYYFLWQQKLDNVLLEHIKQASWQAAADLIAQHGHLIKDRALFSAVKQFSDKSHEKWHPAIANAAYRLLLHSRYDKRMLDVVLTHFKGSQAQWLALSHALSAISIHEPRLDEIILKNATWAHHFDEETQRIFIRSTANQRAAGLWDFICYAAHEMIVGNVRPLTETIVALERLHSEGADKQAEDHILLTYGLCHVYLTHDIHTFRSEAIIQEAIQMQEKSGIIFPVFRGSKKISSTYIEKYRPFMYKTLPGKDVRLYYKVDGEGDWRVKNMGYWRFGLYLARVPHFYNEVLTYYFSEEMPTGSIATREAEIHNKDMHLDESQTDPFFIINNATIYEQMFRYEQVEEIIGGLVKDVRNVRSRLM